mgnify:CR=1 FL=1
MKSLFLTRHAKSSWDHAGLSDIDRPLNSRGKKAAPRMGELIHKKKDIPNILISSPAHRAFSTAKAFAETFGYIENDKLVSLRGTLVPATTINKTIGSIPLLGKILVGSKVGEGVFGVSFKIKGPPKKLETSVNPIKTLTPRFITRTLEKLKKIN